MAKQFPVFKPRNSIAFIFLKIAIFLVFLTSLRAWFTWSFHILIINALAIMAVIIFYLSRPSAFKFSKLNIASGIFFFFIKLYTVKTGNINAFIGATVGSVLIVLLLCFNDVIKAEILNFITKAFGVVLFVSIIFWIFFLIGIPLPFLETNYNDGQYFYNNHFFFLYNIHSSQSIFIPRFSSVFLEPGHLGMITAFLLFIYKMDFRKKEILIIFIASIFTFSLASYLLMIIAATSLLLINSKKPVQYTVIWGSLLFSLYVLFSNYNEGDNTINLLILERLKWEGGDIAGNNRFTEYLDSYYKQFIVGDSRLLGVGIEYNKMDWGGGNAGYKQFVIEHGIIGAILVLVFYISLVLSKKSIHGVVLFILYFLAFLQAAYALWECELIVFFTALTLFRRSWQIKSLYHDRAANTFYHT